MAGPLSVRGKERPIIAPSLLSADPLDIGGSVDSLREGFDWLHLDVMNVHFVTNLSYCPALIETCRRRWPDTVIDVHLMVEKPGYFLEAFAKAGSTVLTVHQEATPHLHRVLQEIRDLGCSPGVTLNPGTPVETLTAVLGLVDLVLVMSVNPGFGGQAFIPGSLEKARLLCCWREVLGCDYLVEIDGGIGPDNAARVVAGGCDVLVAGSAIFNTPEPHEAVREIRARALEGVLRD